MRTQFGQLESIAEDQEIQLSEEEGMLEMRLPDQRILADGKNMIATQRAVQEVCREGWACFAIFYEYVNSKGSFCTLYELVNLSDGGKVYRPYATHVKVNEDNSVCHPSLVINNDLNESFS